MRARIPSPRSVVDELVLSLGVACNLVVALALQHFPYQDAVNHLARYSLINRAWSAHPVEWVTIRLVPTAYLGGDLVGTAIIHLLDPRLAYRVLGILPLVVLPVGYYALLRATVPARRGWAALAPLLSFNVFYLQGLLAYSAGLGLALLWLAFWWPRRVTSRARDRAGLGIAAVALYLIHLSAPLIAMGVVTLECAVFALGSRSAPDYAEGVKRRLTNLLFIAAPFGIVWGTSLLMTSSEPIVPPVPEWRPWLMKLRYVAYPFFVYSLAQAAGLAIGYGLALGWFLATSWKSARSSMFLLAGPAFLLVYLVSPANSAADLRWLQVAFLLPFCAPGPARPVNRALLCLLLICTAAQAAIVLQRGWRIDRELSAYDEVLRRVPAESRILPLVSDHFRDGHLRPYFHYALWHTVDTGAKVAGLFARDGVLEGQETWRHFDHFVLDRPFYFPVYDWGSRMFTPLDCRRIHQDYDLIVQAGSDATARARIEACATLASRIGDITVYRVDSQSERTAGDGGVGPAKRP